MSTYRTIFTAEEAQDHFGDYLQSLKSQGLAEEHYGYENKLYWIVLVEPAIEMIKEWVKDECGI